MNRPVSYFAPYSIRECGKALRKSDGGGHTVTQLTHANEARHIFIEHLKATAVFLGLAWVAESTGSVEDFGEGVEVNYSTTTN